jgi:hypothetical protein
MPGQVEIDDLRVGGEPREIRLEVGMVETPRSAVKQHDGGPISHFGAVGHKRRAVDVEPQSRPLHLNIHPRRILTRSRRREMDRDQSEGRETTPWFGVPRLARMSAWLPSCGC